MSPRPVDHGARLRRLLAIIPWLAARGSASFAEIGARFGLTEKQVENELLLAACCGLPPYSPDQLIDLMIDEHGVTANVPAYFRRPPQLTAADGFALLAAGRALLAVPGSDPHGPLASAMEKLATALGGDGSGVTVEIDAPPFLDALRDATDARQRVEVDYYSASRDELTTRRIDPLVVVADSGHWYVEAYCHRVEDVLTFRVDRVEALRPTGETFEARAAEPLPPGVFRADADMPLVTLAIPASARWVVETYPVESVEDMPDGRLKVTLAASGEAWLQRLLLRIGPEVRILEPKQRRADRRRAAERVLTRYA